MFEFVKLKLTDINGSKVNIEYDWMLFIDSIEMLDTYMERIQSGIIEKGLRKLITKDYAMHCTDQWEYACEFTAMMKGTSVIQESCDLENRIYRSRIHSILTYGGFYVNQNGGGFPYSEKFKVTDRILKHKLVFPDYSIEDIKIFQWPRGNHWYAKINSVDVVDNKGNQRWNTRDGAEQAVNEYLAYN